MILRVKPNFTTAQITTRFSTKVASSRTPRYRTASTASETAGLANPAVYCRDLVRKHDYESYMISHFYPKEYQDAYFAIKAFSVELATVQDHVSNTMIAKMRMQFWRDTIKDIQNGRPPRHPISLALHQACQQFHLPSYHLKRVVDARDAELHTPTHLTVDSLTAHAESTSSTVLYLLLSLLSLPSSTLSHAASHLGVAQTFTTLLRALPFHAKNGRMIIPAEITAKHGVNQEEVFRQGPHAQGIEDAVFEFATIANDHMITAREMFKEEGMGETVPSMAMPVFLSGIPVTNYLGRLEKINFNAFEPKLQLRDWKLAWLIWRDYYKRKF
ncbi:isoprenoid synthase domain-containing protein [Cyathus striatus]|nr:isoprenoid synthase domain-containing protein [Cyathus striatus]